MKELTMFIKFVPINDKYETKQIGSNTSDDEECEITIRSNTRFNRDNLYGTIIHKDTNENE